MAKVCLLVNLLYPALAGETFLANELEYLKGFDRIVVIPVFAHEQGKAFDYGKCSNPAVETLIPSAYDRKAKVEGVLRGLLCPELYRELAMLLCRGKLNPARVKLAVSFVGRGLVVARELRQKLQWLTPSDDVVIYAYWMNHSAFAAACLKKLLQVRSVRCISRAHRFDLYEYAAPQEYTPLRKTILREMDLLCPIAEDGRRYLMEHDGLSPEKIRVMRLGTEDHDIHIPPKTETLRIVSCSWMRLVKRVHLIVEALAKLPFQVEWTHFGDGEDFARIQQMVQSMDCPNVRCSLRGSTPNHRVLDAYRHEAFDVFINVSASEGVPVSIMEAMSFGKIIVATNVGGSGEIVREGRNGFLLHADCSAQEVAEALRLVQSLSAEEHAAMCRESRQIWEEMCDARLNYTEFSDMLAGF